MHCSFIFLCFLAMTATSEVAEPNPDDAMDVDNVAPPLPQEQTQTTLKANLSSPVVVTPKIVFAGKKASAEVTTTLLKKNVTTSKLVDFVAAAANLSLPVNETETPKTEVEKREELLTKGGDEKEDKNKDKVDLKTETVEVSTAAVVETKAPVANADDVKENAAPEFDHVDEQVEGGKGEENPEDNAPEKVEPQKDEADGAAKEDRETAAGQAGSLHEAVEEAKGNAAGGEIAPKTRDEDDLTLEPNVVHKIDDTVREPLHFTDEDEPTGFMSWFFIATLLVVCLYLLQHNKKKILGLMFEGRAGKHNRRGHVRYQKLDQVESQRETIY